MTWQHKPTTQTHHHVLVGPACNDGSEPLSKGQECGDGDEKEAAEMNAFGGPMYDDGDRPQDSGRGSGSRRG